MQDLGFAGFRVGALGSGLGVSAQGIQDGPFGVFKNQSARARGICTMASGGGGGGGGWGRLSWTRTAQHFSKDRS